MRFGNWDWYFKHGIMLRKLLACLSACGIAVSVIAYIQGMSGTTIDDRYQWLVVLTAGAIALQIPIFCLERSALRTFSWKGLARGLPKWAVNCIKLAWLITLAHMIWFFLESHHAVPIIKDGQFVLSSRGRIVKVLTQKQYVSFTAHDLSEFAMLMIACYLTPLMYWCSPRNRQQLG